MQLDRFTEKAQEAIVAAQQLAERMQSPVLDAEHLLAALVEPDDGIPAETLRRLGVGPGRVPRRARRHPRPARPDPGRPAQSLDPRAKRVIERAQEEARRLGDEYTSHRAPAARHGRGRRRGASSCSSATAPAARRSSARSRPSAAASG